MKRLVLATTAMALAAAGLTQTSWAGPSQFLPPVPYTAPHDPLAVAQPGDKLLLIYLPGSRKEFHTDSCLIRDANSPWGVPEVIAGLAGRWIAGREVLVYGFCGATKTGTFDEETGTGTSKARLRSRDLLTLLTALRERAFVPRQIFLVGHSAGAWAALLAARQDPDSHNGVIAFAPALAGVRSTRSEAWRKLRRAHLQELRTAAHINALVYGFEGDAFNRPQDLTFLAQIPGVTLLALPADKMGDQDCGEGSPHQLMRQDCFTRSEQTRIVDYITGRLTDSD